MRRALSIKEKFRGDSHLACPLGNLAKSLQATNRFAEAEPMMRRAQAILVASLGDEHPKTKNTRDKYAEIAKAKSKS